MIAVRGPEAALVPMRHIAQAAADGIGEQPEALFLTFNADLAFLESRLLQLCRQAGARVSVVADASVWRPDVRAITGAGIRYHVGLVAAASAFHPKVSVLVGSQRALAIVGSGNLGLGGWQSNAEIASVFEASTNTAPQAMLDLREVLDALARTDALPPASTAAVRQTVGALDRVLELAEIIQTGHRIHGSWQGPLIERLPVGPVDELLMTAPFHDPDSAAIEALLRRMRPHQVRVAVQPGQTVADVAALERVLREHAVAHDADAAIIVDADSRYRHGKLVEWSVSGARAAMTGSANLSRAALLASAPRANFETVVVGPVARSLFPAGDVRATSTGIATRALPPRDDADASRAPIIVSATLDEGAITVDVAWPRPAIIEIAPYDEPEGWRSLAPFEGSAASTVVGADARGGDRLRLVWTDSSGNVRRTPAMFVVDPLAVQEHLGERGAQDGVRRASASDLWGDDATLLDLLLEARQEAGHGDGSPRSRSESATTADEQGTIPGALAGEQQGWLWERAATVATYGGGLGAFALGLPTRAARTDARTPSWTEAAEVGGADDGPAERETAEDTTEPEEVVGEAMVDPPHEGKSLVHARRRQRWAARAVEVSADGSVSLQMLVLRIILHLWRQGDWGVGDDSPLRLIHAATRSVVTTALERGAASPDLQMRAASLATVAVTLLQPGERSSDDMHRDRFRTLRAVVAPHMHRTTDEQVVAYLEGLVPRRDVERVQAEARSLRDDALSGDPWAEVQRVRALHETTVRIDRPALHLLHVVAKVPRSQLEWLALDMLSEVEEHRGVGIRVEDLAGSWVLLVWDAPDLVRARGYPNGRVHVVLRPMRSLMPSSIRGAKKRDGHQLGRDQGMAAAIAVLRRVDAEGSLSVGR